LPDLYSLGEKMQYFKSLLCALLLSISFSSYSLGLTDLSDILFDDTATGIEGQLKDAKFEFDAYAALLLDAELSEHTHILVSRNRGSVLITGQASSKALRDKVQTLVLGVARVKWKEGDVNNVEPANAQICGEAARNITGNDKRKFNLKTVDECSTVNRLYNEVTIRLPLNEAQQSDDDLLRAKIVNKLLYASIIDRADAIKVVVTDGQVYLLGDQLSEKVAEQATQFVMNLEDVKKVVPLFRF
jgi:osmotically-inducible protein OsmY